MMSLEDRVRRAVRACGVAPGSCLLIGLSGGPDSTALLRALASMKADMGLTLRACIVDHGIRGAEEIEADIAFARSLCRSQGIPLTVARIPAGRCRERAERESRSLEEVAREERHRLLRSAALGSGARWIALGHTRDDLLETLLMRVMQGSDVAALAGIARARGALVRPLLGCARTDILSYLRSLGQDWREDRSNRDLSILRNRIRHILMPVLDREFAGARSGILAMARKAELAAEVLRERGKAMGWTATAHGFAVSREVFLAAPAAVRAAELMRLYDQLRGPGSPRRLPWRFIMPVLGGKLPRSRGRILQGHGVQLAARGGRLCWERCIVTSGKIGYFIEVSETGSYSVPETGTHVCFARSSAKRSPVTGEIALLARDIEPPLVLRSRRRGDEILLENGATSLKELFAGWKVSEGQRNAVPVLADRKGVVAILGAALGCPTRSRAGSVAPGGADGDCILVGLTTNMEEGREQQQRE